MRAPPVTPEIAFTNDLADYSLMVELARDSTTFAAIQTTALSSVWTVRDGELPFPPNLMAFDI
jgi:hypothetical protein